MKRTQRKRARLIELRKAHSMTQKEVAHAAKLTRSYYGLIENGVRNPTLEKAVRIADAFGTSVENAFPDEVFFGDKCYDMKLTKPRTSA